MLAKNDYTSDYFIYHNEERYLLSNKRQNVKEDQRDLVDKSSDNKSVRNMLPRHTPQDRLLASELSFSLKKIWFSKQEFLTGTLISNIKYNYLRS